MKAIHEMVRRLLRSPAVSVRLQHLGIDARRFWLLMDLFDELSLRGEMMDQLGRNGVALRTSAAMYVVVTALLGIVLVVTHASLLTYSATFLAFTAFLLFTVLLAETGNSLLNPAEGLVLAHHPISGATYTAAKLTHLGRIVLYITLGINGIPAILGLMLKDAPWYYPLIHWMVAICEGVLAALLCCALYGWLMRFIPASRLRAAGQLAGTLPFLAIMLQGAIRPWLKTIHLEEWLPQQREIRWALASTAVIVAVAVVVLGIRSLSADYLIRVSTMMHHSSKLHSVRSHKNTLLVSRTSGLFAKLLGGQSASAGFAFVSQMMRRDYQFRRQVLLISIVVLVEIGRGLVQGWRTDPFSGRFTTMHLLPHALGLWLAITCGLLAYGSDYKGAWIFLLAPVDALGGFARGLWAALGLYIIVLPHLALFIFLAWSWGLRHGLMFVAYSLALSACYLAVELRLIDSLPFSSQTDATRGAIGLPVMMLIGAVAAIFIGLQHFLVFHSPTRVLLATAILGGGAWLLTQNSLSALEATLRASMATISGKSGTFYVEIDA